MPQARFVHGETLALDHTPSGADVESGDVVVVGSRIGIAKLKIVDGELGAVHEGGVYDIAKADGISGNDGDPIYWDVDGNPQGGVAGSGAADTSHDTGTNKVLGHAVKAFAAGDTTIRVRHCPPPIPAS